MIALACLDIRACVGMCNIYVAPFVVIKGRRILLALGSGFSLLRVSGSNVATGKMLSMKKYFTLSEGLEKSVSRVFSEWGGMGSKGTDA